MKKEGKWEKKITAYALKNAIEHEGRAEEGKVISALFHEGLEKSEVKSIITEVKEEVARVNNLAVHEQKKEFEGENLEKQVGKREGREGLPDLPNAKKGRIIMRFAPSASGPLHVGHALTASISLLYVQKYGGKFYVRIEDTNPENIYPKAYEMIEKESKWLFKNKCIVQIQSDNLHLYYKYAEKLINKKAAYVCGCSAEEFKNYVEKKENCPCRKNSVKENTEKWKKMLDKKGYKEEQAVLRFKSNMKDKNPAMRDFPLARINETKHPRQKKKYRVWPLMNLAVFADDIETGMTHIIRAKEHRDNAKRQEMMYKALGKGKEIPWTAFLGRIHFKDFELSTTKTRKAIEAGKYKGWDDPKLPTIAAIMKKGRYNPEAFWKFAEQIGLNEHDKIMSEKEFFDLLESFNKLPKF